MHKGFVLVLAGCILFGATSVFADATCSGRIATDADHAQYSNIPAGSCIDQKTLTSLGLDAATSDAIQYLSAHVCPGETAGFPAGFDVNNTDPANWNPIRCTSPGYVYFKAGNTSMNPGAMKCFVTFFKQAEAQGFQPCMKAALRTPAHQRSSCIDQRSSCPDNPNGAVCGKSRGCPDSLSAYTSCGHVNGLAMDIADSRDAKKVGSYSYALFSLGRKSGLFSIAGTIAGDPVHFEAANCADPNFKPNASLTDTWSGSGQTDPFRSALAGLGLTTPPQQCPAGSVNQNGICYPLQAQPAMTQPMMGSGTGQVGSAVGQPSTIGTASNNTGVSGLITPTSVGTASNNTGTVVDTSGNASQQSISDLLLSMAAASSSAVTPGTSTPLSLNGDIGNAANGLAGNPPQGNANTNVNAHCVNTPGGTLCPQGAPTNDLLGGSITSMQPGNGQNTFTSADMGGASAQSGTVPGQTSTFQQVLANLQVVLVKILSYLKPFGGVNPHTVQTTDMSAE